MDDTEDRLLVGEALGGDAVPDAVTAFLGDARGALVEPPGEEAAAAHLRAMARAAQAEPAAAPPRPRLKVPPPLRPGFATGAAIVLLAACATLAALGALPGPVQAALADASRVVGVEVPDPDASRPGEKPDAARPASPLPPAADRPEVPVSRAPSIGLSHSLPADESDPGDTNAAPRSCPDPNAGGLVAPLPEAECEPASGVAPDGDTGERESPESESEGLEEGEEPVEPYEGEGPEAAPSADPPAANEASATG